MSQDDRADAGLPDQHILYREGQWVVVPEGAEDAVNAFDSREEALRWAGRSLSHQGATLIVYNEDGTVNDTVRPNP